ncbi:MAG: phage late control D family protein [Acidimicrobiales bacterium]
MTLNAPVFTVDGDLARELARDVVWLDVAEDVCGLRRLEAAFDAADPFGGEDGDLLHLDGATIGFGRELTVSLGPDDDQHIVFVGTISALAAERTEGTIPLTTVWAEDRLDALRTTRRSRTYHDLSDADIARLIAADHRLTPAVDAAGPTYDRVQQINQTDLAFLRERAERVGADVWLDGTRLVFAGRDRSAGPAVTLVYGNELIAVRARADLAQQRTAIRVSGYDAAQRAVIEREAGPTTIDAEVTGGRTGPAVLERAVGPRPGHRVRDVPLSGDEAEAWARAEMLGRCRRFVTVEGETSGTPALTVGAALTLERVGGIFAGGGYRVTEVRHTYDPERGHRTGFRAERPTITEAP